MQPCTPPPELLFSISAQSGQTPSERPLSQDISVPCHSGDLCNSHTRGHPVSPVKYTVLLLSNFLTWDPGQELCAHLIDTVETHFVPQVGLCQLSESTCVRCNSKLLMRCVLHRFQHLLLRRFLFFPRVVDQQMQQVPLPRAYH